MSHTASDSIACRQGAHAALVTLFGIVTSGPLALVVLQVFWPQPPWQNAAEFARNFHVAQSVPYLAGLFLVSGYVVLIASLHALAEPEQRPATTAALIFTGAYAALIFFNYMVQTTFVPSLALGFEPAHALALGMWSMAHPRSLAWGVELWGYACLGMATWLVAPVLAGRARRSPAAVWAFRANGLVSIAAALWMVVEPGWAVTPLGLAAFAVWNVLAFVMSWLAFDVLRSGFREPATRIQPALRSC
ncbi:MAG TPA: hypothetical protein VJV78_19895 [Polyangiales bacterium]|nr:hypothetical protein [Polyangiales bacterium]